MVARYNLNHLPIQETMQVPDTQGTLNVWIERAATEGIVFNKVVPIKIVRVTDSGASPLCPLCKKVCALGEDDHVICNALCGDLANEKPLYKYITKVNVAPLDGMCWIILHACGGFLKDFWPVAGEDAYPGIVWNAPAELVFGMPASDFAVLNDVQQTSTLRKMEKDFIAATKITAEMVHINMLWDVARQVITLLLPHFQQSTNNNFQGGQLTYVTGHLGYTLA